MKNKTKILLIVPLTTTDWGTKNAGGVDTVCQMTIEYIVKQKNSNFEYRVLAFDPLKNHIYTGEVVKLAPHVELVWLSNNKTLLGKFTSPSLIYMTYKIRQQIKLFQPNIVHSHIWSWLIGVPKSVMSVATVHSYKSIARKSVSILNDLLYVSLIPKITRSLGDEIVCVGAQLQQAVQLDISNKVKLIGNPIDKDYFVKRSPLINKHTTVLVTCAILTPRKQIEMAIELTHKLNLSKGSFTLNIIGPASDKKYFSNLKKQVVDLNIEENVNFLGALSKNEIIEEYKNADIGVFFSKEETFGLAPLEMLATGLPLLSTEVGILAEKKSFFEKVGVTFVNVEQPEKILLAAQRLVKNLDVSDARKLQAEFSVTSVVKQYEGLYKELSEPC